MQSIVTDYFFDFMLIMFDHINQLYEMGEILLIDTILKYHLRKEIAKENSSKPSPSRKESAKENTSKTYPKKGYFVDETNRTSQANSDSYKTHSNAKKGACNEAGRSEEEHVGMRDIMIKGDFEHSNEVIQY